jgi:hypothetical protein
VFGREDGCAEGRAEECMNGQDLGRGKKLGTSWCGACVKHSTAILCSRLLGTRKGKGYHCTGGRT